MINNFEQIKKLLTFESEDDFYFSQIIKRKKEHTELGSNSHIVKCYYINSIDSLEKNIGEMICLADYHNARVYINLNKRSFERIAFHSLKKTTDIIMNKDYKSARKAYNSVCGTYSADKNKKWVIDIDYVDTLEVSDTQIISIINSISPVGDKFIAKIPTKNGYHLITKPFNLQEVNNLLTMDIHKDNPTILYHP